MCLTGGMANPEELRCNICETMLIASEASKHSSTLSHNSLKSRIENDLEKIRNEDYRNDSSVILRWKSSV